MGRLRTAVGIAADLSSIATMVLFLIVTVSLIGAAARGRLGPAPEGPASKQPTGARVLSERASGRIPLRSGTEYVPAGVRLALVEFGAFDCSYCARFDREIWPELKEEFVDTGKLAFVYRDMPREGRPAAMRASRAASCSGDKPWQMHTQLFAMRGQFPPDQLLEAASGLDLDVNKFSACMSSGSSPKAEVDGALGRLLGVSVTPTFFIGRITGDEVEITWKLLGAQPVEVFRETVARLSAEEVTRRE